VGPRSRQLAGQVASVHGEDVARHHGGGLAEQEHDRSDDLRDLAESAQRRPLPEPLIHLGPEGPVAERERCVKGRWRDRVDPDAVPGEFDSQCPGDLDDAAFAGGVADQAGEPI
jgi:hypothetical protein